MLCKLKGAGHYTTHIGNTHDQHLEACCNDGRQQIIQHYISNNSSKCTVIEDEGRGDRAGVGGGAKRCERTVVGDLHYSKVGLIFRHMECSQGRLLKYRRIYISNNSQ